MTTGALRIVVKGEPAAQGSKRHIGKGVLIEASAKVKPWREQVHWAALEQVAQTGWQRAEGPVKVMLDFHFDRPRAHYRTGRNAHLLRPDAPAYPCTKNSKDVDKLVRACLDALTTAGVWRDDSQVVWLQAGKLWTDSPNAMLHTPGVWISVQHTLLLYAEASA